MDLQDIVDGTEGSNIFKAPSPAAESKLKKSFSCSDVLTASVTRDLLKMETSYVNVDQVTFDSDRNSAMKNDTRKIKQMLKKMDLNLPFNIWRIHTHKC